MVKDFTKFEPRSVLMNLIRRKLREYSASLFKFYYHTHNNTETICIALRVNKLVHVCGFFSFHENLQALNAINSIRSSVLRKYIV